MKCLLAISLLCLSLSQHIHYADASKFPDLKVQMHYPNCIGVKQSTDTVLKLVDTSICKADETCDFNNDLCVKNQKKFGETCRHEVECFSGICHQGRCSEARLNDSCSSSAQCEVGLFCSSKPGKPKTCQKQLREGEICLDTYECENHLACGGVIDEDEFNVCRDYFSISDGQELFYKADPRSCQSGYIGNKNYSSYCMSSTLINETTLNEPFFCRYESSLGTDRYTKQSVRPLSSESKAEYCPADSRNYIEYNDKLKEYVKTFKGHTLLREDDPELKHIYLNSYRYPYFKGADAEVICLFTGDKCKRGFLSFLGIN